MKVIVIGKSNRKGTSKKSGNPYDLNFLSIAYKLEDVEGYETEKIIVDNQRYPYSSIELEVTYQLDRNSSGKIIEFNKVKA